MSDSSTPTPIPSIKRVDSDISAIRHEISQIQEVLEQVSEIQLRSAEMNNRLLEALDRATQERSEQTNQFVERDQFIELVRKTAREELTKAPPSAQKLAAPIAAAPSFMDNFKERRSLWLAVPLILALFASAAAGYRLFNEPDEPAAGLSQSESQAETPTAGEQAGMAAAPSGSAAEAEPAASLSMTEADSPAPEASAAPATVATAARDDSAPQEAAQGAPMRVQELDPNPPAVAATEPETSPAVGAPESTNEAARSAASEAGKRLGASGGAAKDEPALVVETTVSPTSSTSRLFIPAEEPPAAAPSELASKPGPDLSALWDQRQPQATLGTVAATAAASNAMEPSAGLGGAELLSSGTAGTIAPSTQPAAESAATEPLPVPKPPVTPQVPQPAAAAPEAAPASSAQGGQIASTTATVPSVPAAPSIRPEVAMVLQRNLKRLGYYDGEVDGSVGPKTRKAIESFQSAIGNEPTGKLSADEMFRLAQDAERASAQ